jgi:NCAIR mutase (PurE)-related protein
MDFTPSRFAAGRIVLIAKMLDERSIRHLLLEVSQHEKSVEEALASLKSLPYEDLGFARVDHHRALRRGCPEVIFCAGKTPEQVAVIAGKLADKSARILGTRASSEHFQAAKKTVSDLQYDEAARCIWMEREPDRRLSDGVVLVAAGTSDIPVAEEAARTLQFLGHRPARIYDVGVAGLHRLLDHLPAFASAQAIIVVAGMEGALPSVVAGLVCPPLIAVPTSVGYGASFGGLAPLLTMLNSCAPGIAIVNIDNGFGAAYIAAQIATGAAS